MGRYPDTSSRPRTRSRSRSSLDRPRSHHRSRSRSRSPVHRDRSHGGDGHRRRHLDSNRDIRREDHERPSKRRRHSHRGTEATGSHSQNEKEERERGRSHRHRHRRHSPRQEAPALPFGARQLSRGDLAAFMPLFAYYLDLQKQIDIASLGETELRGRWKSFVGKWNRGELAEGWFDPALLQRLLASSERSSSRGDSAAPGPGPGVGPQPSAAAPSSSTSPRPDLDDSEDDSDDYGPPPPPTGPGQRPSRSPNVPSGRASSSVPPPPGPAIPSRADLAVRDEEALQEREQALADRRLARRAHRADQKLLLDELAPRADPGTRERKLEKRREMTEKLRGFKEDREGVGQLAEVGEAELMGGGGDDSVDEYRRALRAREEVKRERQSRREEEERARRKELEERVREYRAREERVIEGLREIARARFG